MRPNPATPINFVEKPVHYHEQNNDRDKAGRCLQVERRNTFRKLSNDFDSDKPCDYCRDESHACTHRNTTPTHLISSGHTRADLPDHQYALTSFAPHADPPI